MDTKRKSTLAQIKAVSKYDSKAYDKKLVRFKHDEWQKLKQHTTLNGYTDNGFIVSAVMYCIDNNIYFKHDKGYPVQIVAFDGNNKTKNISEEHLKENIRLLKEVNKEGK